MLQLLEQTKVDILLTDVMMPGMNGAELSKAVLQKFPSIKILAPQYEWPGRSGKPND